MTQSELQLTMLLLVAIDQGNRLAAVARENRRLAEEGTQLLAWANETARSANDNCDRMERLLAAVLAERDALRAELARQTEGDRK